MLSTVIGGIWVAFSLGWLAAATTAKRNLRRDRWQTETRIGLIVLIIMLRAVIRPHGLAVHVLALQIVGSMLFVAGLAVAVWARICLGGNWGMPMTEKRDAELVTQGPYRVVRNPIYSGILMAVVGTAIALDLWVLAIAIVLGLYFVYSAVVEEKIMGRLFPDTYPAYRARTRRLIPFVF